MKSPASFSITCLQPFSEFVSHFSFDDVKDHFEADMDVRISDASRRNGGDVGRQARRAHIFARHPLFVMNAVPISLRAAAANGQESHRDLPRRSVRCCLWHPPFSFTKEIVERSIVNHPTPWRGVFTTSD